MEKVNVEDSAVTEAVYTAANENELWMHATQLLDQKGPDVINYLEGKLDYLVRNGKQREMPYWFDLAEKIFRLDSGSARKNTLQ